MKYLSTLVALCILLASACGGSSDDCGDDPRSLEDYISEEIDQDSFTVQTFAPGTLDEFQYIIRAPGDPNAMPTISDTIQVTYRGTLTDGREFDAGTATFPLAGLIRGWQLGIPLIGEGGSMTLFLPPGLAYGTRSVGIICPGSPLVFEIDLLQVGP